MTDSLAFSGTRALVTGAASGIGNAIARKLASKGCQVIGVDRNPIDDLETFAETFCVDLTVATERAELIARVGKIDYLVNAAGVSIIRRLEETSETDWDQTLAINSKVPFFLMQGFAPQMPEGSAIVNVASVSGKMATNVYGAPYNASKAAVLALTKTLAYALAPQQIRVNAICPGVTETPMLEKIWQVDSELTNTPVDELVQQYLTRVPLGRLGEPEEIADATLFLLSEESRYMTGQSVNVCGGLVMS